MTHDLKADLANVVPGSLASPTYARTEPGGGGKKEALGKNPGADGVVVQYNTAVYSSIHSRKRDGSKNREGGGEKEEEDD